MRILWVNSGTAKTFSNTRLFGMPPELQKLGDVNRVLIAGKAAEPLPDYFQSLPLPFGRIGLYRLLATWYLPFLCFSYKPDVVISDWMSAKLLRFVDPFRSLGILRCKLVHDVRTVPVKEDRGKSYRVFAENLQYAKKRFDGLTTITEALREEICRGFHFHPEQIAVWTSGVDAEHFKPQNADELRQALNLSDQFVLFYHGAVNENRGVIELAQAMQYLDDLPDIRLLIIGGGNQWAKLQDTVLLNNLSKVILKPGVSYRDIPRWIAVADLCVVPLPDHPWWKVSSPLKLMEYLAMGKPVLLTDILAHRVVLPDAEDAFYVNACHPEQIAAGIRRAYQQRSHFAEMSKKARSRAVQELSWGKQARLLRNYLLTVFEGGVKLKENRANVSCVRAVHD
ncbi:MAG: glycosyltransferase family 4 protein [bacterium]